MLVQRLVSLMQIKPDPAAVRETNSALADVKGKLSAIAAIAAPAAIAAVGFAQLRAATAAADASAKTARSVGITTEAYQELTHAAALSGVNQEQLNKALFETNKRANDAATGNQKLAKTYRGLGISLAELRKQKPDEQLETIAGALAKVEDPAKRVRLQTELLGEAGPKFASFFAGGAAGIRGLRQEARDLGLVIDDKQAQAAEAFNDQLDRLSAIGKGLKQRFLLELLPAISPIIDDLVRWSRADAKGISGNLEAITLDLREFLKMIRGGIKDLRELIQLLGGLGNTLKLLALVFGAFLAAKYLVLAAQGMSVLTVANLRLAAATALNTAAQWAALIPYALLALAIAAVVLLVEDFVRFTQGQDSLMKDLFGEASPEFLAEIKLALVAILGLIAAFALLVGSVPVAIAAIGAAIVGLALNWDDVVDALADALLEMWRDFSAWFDDVSKGFTNWANEVERDLQAWWSDLVKGWLDQFSKLFARIQSVAKRVGVDLENPLEGATIAAQLVGGGATGPAVDMQAGALAVANAQPRQEINVGGVTIEAAPNMPPAQLRRVVADGISDAALRDAGRALASGPGGV